MEYYFPRKLDSFYVKNILGLPSDSPQVIESMFQKSMIENNPMLKLWLICNMDSTFLKEYDLHFETVRKELKDYQFDINSNDVIPMIFLEGLLHSDGVSGIINDNALHIYMMIRIVRLKYYMKHVPHNHSLNDEDDIICGYLIDLLLSDINNPKGPYNVSSVNHAMLVYQDSDSSKNYLCNAGGGSECHPSILLNKITFVQATLSIPKSPKGYSGNFKELTIESIYNFLGVVNYRKREALKVYETNQPYYSIWNIKFFIDPQDKLVYMTKQQSGTCSYYSIMIYLIMCMSRNNRYSDKQIADYFQNVYDVVFKSLSISEHFKYAIHMSKAHAFLHLMKKTSMNNTKRNIVNFQKKFYHYRSIYLQQSNDPKPIVNESSFEFELLHQNAGNIMEWDKKLTEDDWFDTHLSPLYCRGKYGRVYAQHYMNKVRDLWDVKIPKITDNIFPLLFCYLEIVLTLNEYNLRNNSHSNIRELNWMEGRQLSVTFYAKYRRYIRHILPPDAHEKWEYIMKSPFNDDERWRIEAKSLLPFFEKRFGSNWNPIMVRKAAIFERVLSSENYPGIYVPWIVDSMGENLDDTDIPEYYKVMEGNSIHALELPLHMQKISKIDFINNSHPSWQIEKPKKFANYRIMVRNYLEKHFVFEQFETGNMVSTLSLCSHYRVKLQVENILADSSIVETWRQTDEKRFYCYCWALLMCHDKRYGDEYVLQLMGTITEGYPCEYYILLHLHNHQEYLTKFCPYDGKIYSPLDIHVQMIHGNYVTHKKDLICKEESKHLSWTYKVYPCISKLNQKKIMAMVDVLREIATVIIYYDQKKQIIVIDVSAHETEHDLTHTRVPPHRWIRQKDKDYWQLEKSDWRIYDEYSKEMELEWITYSTYTGCVLLLKTSEQKYGLLVIAGYYIELQRNKYWKYYNSNNHFRMEKSYYIIEATITKSIDYEAKPMISPVIKDDKVLKTLWQVLSFYVSPLVDRIYAMCVVNGVEVPNFNSFLIDHKDIIQGTEPNRIKWYDYWMTQNIVISRTYDVYQYWYEQGGLKPRLDQSQEIQSLIEKKSSCMKQYIMGAGKSSVIIPHLVLHHLQLALPKQVCFRIVLVQPEHLQKSAFLTLSKLSMIQGVFVSQTIPNKVEDENRIDICVVSDVKLKQGWKNLVQKRTRINVLIIDEFDSVCMPCKSDFNICSEMKQGISKDDELYPELFHWLQHELPFLIIEKLPLRKISKDELIHFCENFDHQNKHHHYLFGRLVTIYNNCIKWNYNVEYGFRVNSPFVVPYITTGIPNPDSEFQSNEVRYIASCLALRQEGHLLPQQQAIFDKQITSYINLGIIHKNTNSDLIVFVSHYLFPQLKYSTNTENVNMTDVLVKQQDRVIYAFSGTTAIPMYKKLQVNCIHLDPSFYKINYMLNPAINKYTAPDFTEEDYRSYLDEDNDSHKVRLLKETMNVQMPISQLLPIEDNDKTIWKSLKPFDVVVDSCGFFKRRKHMDLVKLMHLHLKRPIVYIDRQHNIKVYPGNASYPYQSLDTNFDRPRKFPNYIYYFDHNHIVGTDIKHPKHLKVLIITNYTSKEYVVVQAMYRVRGVHEKDNGHQVQFALDTIYTSDTKQMVKGYDPKRLIQIGEEKIPSNAIKKGENVFVKQGLKSLRTQSKIWKRNEKDEIERNRIYLQYQYELALFKLESDKWNIEEFSRDLKDNCNLESTVQMKNNVQAQVNLSARQQKAKSKVDDNGRMMSINRNTGLLSYDRYWDYIIDNRDNDSSDQSSVIVTDYCVRYLQTSMHEYKHVLFKISQKSSNTALIIHIDELIRNLQHLRPDQHIISNIYGHEIFPNATMNVDWILPVMTHSPSLYFYHMLEFYHNASITRDFFELQKIFETKWTLFTPIVSFDKRRNITSTIFDQKAMELYKQKLESNKKLLYMIREIIRNVSIK